MGKTHKCIVCGKEGELPYSTELPHGTIHICSNACNDILTLKINGNCFPVVWVSPDDLNDGDEDNPNPMTREEYENMPPEDTIEIARDTGQAWGDSLFHELQESLKEAVRWWRIRVEERRIKTCPAEDLPLFVDNIQFDDNIKVFEERLRNVETERKK